MKKQASVEEFADALKDDPSRIIAWCESEIKEYKKLIAILKKRV